MYKLAVALAVASAFWGGQRCTRIDVGYAALPGDLGGIAEIGGCYMRIDRRRWDNQCQLNAVVAHEEGHLGRTGVENSADPDSFMYGMLTTPQVFLVMLRTNFWCH